MMSSSVSINSLFYECMTKTTQVNHQKFGKTFLPIQVRQELIDYFVRQKVPISCQLLCDLISNGGVYSFDLWTLSTNNNYNADEMKAIFDTLAANCLNLKELTLGGHNWIYKKQIVEGPMRKLFSCDLDKLRSLKLQQTSSVDELIAIFKACPNMIRFEISQPSITCRDVSTIEMIMCSDEKSYSRIRQGLREIKVPSTCKNGGIIKLLSLFPNVQWFNCCHFESVMKAVLNLSDYDKDGPFYSNISNAASTVSKLRGLTITHPLGMNTVEKLVHLCPLLEELSLEVQKGMTLSPVAKLTNLRKLELHNSQTLPSSYLQQVLPLLRSIGSNLTSLALEQFDVIDLTSCACYCSNLETFSGQWFTLLSFNKLNSTLSLSKEEKKALRNPFSKLTSLHLRPKAQRDISPEILQTILCNAQSIEHIELYSCPNLTDADLKQLMKSNSMKYLKRLILKHGHSVTKSFLRLQIVNCWDLQYLDYGRPILSKAELVPNDDNE